MFASRTRVASFAGLFFAYMPAYLTAVARYDPLTAVFAQTYEAPVRAASA